MHRNIAWDKVENPNPQNTPQVPPSFEETTPPVTHLEDIDETIGIPTEVEPLDHMKLEDLGLNTNTHDLFLSSKGFPSFDEPKPQPKPLANFPTLDISLGDEIGPQPPIKQHSPDSFRMKGRIEAVGSDGHLRSCLYGLGGVVGCRESRRYDRLAGSRRIRVGTWNVGSLIGKHLEVVDALGRHKVNIACFQETKWKGSSTREGNGYKLWYSGSSSGRNRVGVILTARLKDNVVQVGLSDAIKKKIWDDLDEIVRECPTDQYLFIGGDLNGHIGSTADGYARVHGGFGFGARNEEWRVILEFATTHDLVTLEHARTAGPSLVRHAHLNLGRARILWKNLKGDVSETFKATVAEKLSVLEEDMSTSSAEQLWNTLAHTIKDVARDSLGVVSESARTHSTHRESWWFSEEVLTKVAAKQSRFKELLSCRKGNLEGIDSTTERKDLGNVRYIKDEGGRTIVREEEIRKRWGEYFCSLFNESRPEGSKVRSSSPLLPQDCYYSRINQREVRIALQNMGRNKVVGPDQIPIEAWKCLKDEGVKWLTCLFNKIFSSAKMPNEWRLSKVIPIYKKQGWRASMWQL
ncbi:retrovirus-related pol polyprotein LINE-1 [Tanacetum coccineum]